MAYTDVNKVTKLINKYTLIKLSIHSSWNCQFWLLLSQTHSHNQWCYYHLLYTKGKMYLPILDTFRHHFFSMVSWKYEQLWVAMSKLASFRFAKNARILYSYNKSWPFWQLLDPYNWHLGYILTREKFLKLGLFGIIVQKLPGIFS